MMIILFKTFQYYLYYYYYYYYGCGMVCFRDNKLNFPVT